MGRKRTCELPFCKGVVEGTRNKRRCDNDRNIHLHQIISKNVKKIMRYIESRGELTANDVNRDLFKNRLDKNEKGSMYRLFQAMVREAYLVERGKKDGLKVYAYSPQKDEPEINETKPIPAQPKPDVRRIMIEKLWEFVNMKCGYWNHDDWLWLINRPDIRELGFPDHEIGNLLEQEKSRYWSQKRD